MRVRPSQIATEHQRRDQQHEGAIGGKLRAVDFEQREVEQLRHPVGHRQQAPGHLHDLLDDQGKAEREQQLGDVAVAMDAPQPPHLDGRANQPAEQRRDDQRRPEADIGADGVGEIGAQHVGAGMGEVEHAHHAEDEREPARQHEQQHAVDEAVQKRDDKDFHAT